jgi:DNA-binding MarR family transcriptional regulator
MKVQTQRRPARSGASSPGRLEPRDKLGGAPHRTLSLQLWLRLTSCTTIVEKRLRARFEQEFSTTLPRFEVLAAISRYRTGPTMSQISRSMMVTNGNITTVVNRLIADGLVVRAIDGRDRRVATVRLTRRGRASLARMEQAQERWVDTMFADLPEGSLDELMAALANLRRSIDRSAA